MTSGHTHFHVVDTAFGPCGIAWAGRGLTRLLLPGAERKDLEARLSAVARRWDEPTLPDGIAHAAAAIERYFDGAPIRFDSVALDLSGVDRFRRRVYDEACRLGWGETTTYGELARRIGEKPEAAREVGQALGRNPLPLVVPCHRVLAAGGKIGGFSAPGGIATKARMLEMEGTRIGVDERQGSLFAAAELLPAAPPR